MRFDNTAPRMSHVTLRESLSTETDPTGRLPAICASISDEQKRAPDGAAVEQDIQAIRPGFQGFR